MLNKKATCAPTNTSPKDTGFGYTMSVIGGKYKRPFYIFWLKIRCYVIMSSIAKLEQYLTSH